MLLAVSIAVILVATLSPFPGQPTLPVSLCLLCGEHGTADALANVVLFLPLGYACASLGWGGRRVVAGAALLSAAVETAQFALPGRDPSLGDLIWNTAGAVLGVGLRAGFLRLAVVQLPRWTPLAFGASALAMVAATGTLLRPQWPEGTYYGQWTARLGHLGSYDGRVQRVTLGSVDLPGYDLPDSRAARVLLRAGAPLQVSGWAGPPPGRLAPIFSLFTGRQEEILLLGFDHRDIVYRYRTVSQALGLNAPDLRLPDAAADLAPGSRLTIQVQPRSPGFCLTLNARRHCGLGQTPGRFWAFLFFKTRLKGLTAKLLDAVCVALLLLPVGWTLRRNAWSLAALGLSAGALFLVPSWVGLLRATPLESAAAAVALLGPLLQQAYRRRAARASSVPTVSARANSATQRSMRV